MPSLLRLAVLVAGLLLSGFAFATTVTVISLGRGQAYINVNGSTVYGLRAGQVSPEGVKLLNATDKAAVLLVDGRTYRLGLGQSKGGGAAVTLGANRYGHFTTTAVINGVPVRAMVDTGASLVSLSRDDAERMGIDYLRGKRAQASTANGVVTVYVVNLDSVKVGDITVANVLGAVHDVGKDSLPMVLLGMSFLKDLEMRRSGNTLTLVPQN